MVLKECSLQPLFSVETIRHIERVSFAAEGESFPMMMRAAEAVFRHSVKRFPEVRSVVVVAGPGNNGGDALLVGKLAYDAGYVVSIYCVDDIGRYKGDAQKALELVLSVGLEVQVLTGNESLNAGLIVDGVLGIGARLPLAEAFRDIVRQINDAKRLNGCRVASIDIPTGLEADSGRAEDVVQADLTVTMVRGKPGMFVNNGQVCSGIVVEERLESVDCSLPPCALRLPPGQADSLISTPRPPNSYKGTFGHIAVIGGDYCYGGAAIMSAESAAKTGAGLVTLLTRPEHVTPALVRVPAVMALGVGSDLMSVGMEALERADLVVVGPGLGRNEWGRQRFQDAIRSGKALIVDGDGLYWLGRTESRLSPQSILTPHIGEAARLLECSVVDIEANPISALQQLVDRYDAVVVLKGVGTLVGAPDMTPLIVGSPVSGLAKGGSGDVLTGFIASCVGRCDSLFEAAVVGVAWHNRSGYRASEHLGAARVQPIEILDYL